MGEFENIADVLHMLQSSISMPKDKRNTFGKYNYRTTEGILAAVKGFLPAGAHIVLSDAPSQFGDKLVLIATATLHWGGVEVSASSFALHAYTQKGMDQAQISGSASSYARKYALGGLLAIDDGKRDPDAGKPKQATDSEIDEAIAQIEECGDLTALKNVFVAIWSNARHVADHADVIAAKDNRKSKLENNND